MNNISDERIIPFEKPAALSAFSAADQFADMAVSSKDANATVIPGPKVSGGT